MNPTRGRLEKPRYVSTTMSAGRSLKQRWINGFKLAFMAGVMFALAELPFSLAADAIPVPNMHATGCGAAALMWLAYFVVALLVYPILFDWIAAAFRIQFVHKSIRVPPPRPDSKPDPSPGS